MDNTPALFEQFFCKAVFDLFNQFCFYYVMMRHKLGFLNRKPILARK